MNPNQNPQPQPALPPERPKGEEPGPNATRLADAMKRILAADQGELAARMETMLTDPFLVARAALFESLFGFSLAELLLRLDISTEPKCPLMADAQSDKEDGRMDAHISEFDGSRITQVEEDDGYPD